jgi:hypothetical protein
MSFTNVEQKKNSRRKEGLTMKRVWPIIFTILCNAEDIGDGRLLDTFCHPTTPFITPLDGKHLRLIGTSVSCFLIYPDYDFSMSYLQFFRETESSREFWI